MEAIVHVVIKSTGEYSDRREVALRAYSNLDMAKAFVERASAEDRQASLDMQAANERYDALTDEEQESAEWSGYHDDATFYVASVPLDKQP